MGDWCVCVCRGGGGCLLTLMMFLNRCDDRTCSSDVVVSWWNIACDQPSRRDVTEFKLTDHKQTNSLRQTTLRDHSDDRPS